MPNDATMKDLPQLYNKHQLQLVKATNCQVALELIVESDKFFLQDMKAIASRLLVSQIVDVVGARDWEALASIMEAADMCSGNSYTIIST